ncbi:MAG TPA: Crp/Fnr family transcriptional regulator [Burkholderiales bacterium]|nr:Crp/Fnr family transcriptional regulator [Burkholderiales bacterium]
MSLHDMMLRLAKGSPEQQAIEAGEIDAIIDYPGSNVIVLPAARRALRRAARGETETTITNALLAALPRADYQRLLAGLEPLTLRFGEVLHEPGEPIRYVYFPLDCVVSLLAMAEGNRTLEVGVIGHEGMAGLSLALGADLAHVRAVVRATGTAWRIKAARFQEALRQSLPLQRELNRYADAKLALAQQTAACNAFHSVEARLARWLLMTSDCVRSQECFLTQAFMAKMLGVRRGTINEAIGSLQQRNLIGSSRGKISILDRAGLEAAACRCYRENRGRHGSTLAPGGLFDEAPLLRPRAARQPAKI